MLLRAVDIFQAETIGRSGGTTENQRQHRASRDFLLLYSLLDGLLTLGGCESVRNSYKRDFGSSLLRLLHC